MSKYGGVEDKYFYKNIWISIIKYLPESYWYKLKRLNTTFRELIKKSCSKVTDIKILAVNGQIESIIMLGNSYDINIGLKFACRGGHIDIVNLMIAKGANNWNYGLRHACRGGHIDIVNLMIAKGANDWNNGLYGACRGGHIDIVNLMIAKGANDWNYGLMGACRGGHIDIINLMIAKGANRCTSCNMTKHL